MSSHATITIVSLAPVISRIALGVIRRIDNPSKLGTRKRVIDSSTSDTDQINRQESTGEIRRKKLTSTGFSNYTDLQDDATRAFHGGPTSPILKPKSFRIQL